MYTPAWGALLTLLHLVAMTVLAPLVPMIPMLVLTLHSLMVPMLTPMNTSPTLLAPSLLASHTDLLQLRKTNTNRESQLTPVDNPLLLMLLTVMLVPLNYRLDHPHLHMLPLNRKNNNQCSNPRNHRCVQM